MDGNPRSSGIPTSRYPLTLSFADILNERRSKWPIKCKIVFFPTDFADFKFHNKTGALKTPQKPQKPPETSKLEKHRTIISPDGLSDIHHTDMHYIRHSSHHV